MLGSESVESLPFLSHDIVGVVVISGFLFSFDGLLKLNERRSRNIQICVGNESVSVNKITQ